ncbi:MAG: hypothetical protein ACHQSE_02465 [Gemmatimonadales bacterium]
MMIYKTALFLHVAGVFAIVAVFTGLAGSLTAIGVALAIGVGSSVVAQRTEPVSNEAVPA